MTLENFEKLVTLKYRDEREFVEFLLENPGFSLELEREHDCNPNVFYGEDEVLTEMTVGYLEEINLTEEISSDEMEELLDRLDEEQIRERFVLDRLSQSAKISLYFLREGIEYMELIQEGVVGISKALEHYSYDMGDLKRYVDVWIGRELSLYIEEKFEQTKTEFLYYMTKTHMDEVEMTEEEKENKIKITEAMTIDNIPFKLSEEEIKVLELYFGLDKEKRYSVLDIEKEMSLEKDKGEEIFCRALNKISSMGGRMFTI